MRIDVTQTAMRADADRIIRRAIEAVLPDEAVRRALSGRRFPGRVVLVATGKAAWQMAKTATDCLGDAVSDGAVIAKYGHVMGSIPGLRCFEAGHPVPDENSFRATREALRLTEGLGEEDTVLFLLSGGGSALFEDPLVSAEELSDVTDQLLSCGADIVEINTVRKRLSRVKGGRFALHCAPAHVISVVLSDVLGDPPDMIASGPAALDRSTCAQALEVVRKYGLRISPACRRLLETETPRQLPNAEIQVVGSVRALCAAAAGACADLGYEPQILTDRLTCQAKEAGAWLAGIARPHADDGRDLAFIAGGETVVLLTGTGKGGRNQELALSAAAGIDGLDNVVVFSLGSDGTDGPTDAAGGIVDGGTARLLTERGLSIPAVLADNDAYHALRQVDGLLITGPTGTNVNDVAVALIRGKKKRMR